MTKKKAEAVENIEAIEAEAVVTPEEEATIREAIKNRYDIFLLFDVEYGNPNGDPDAGNMPRLDPETNKGLVTDGCVKRKIRNYVELIKGGAAAYAVYVTEGAVLNEQNNIAYVKTKKTTSGKKQKVEIDELSKAMCDHFYDIRTFGAMMNTNVNCGQVRGPVQMGFAQSIDPISPVNVAITRVCPTKKEAADEGKKTEMGSKWVVPYGLYGVKISVSASLADRTGFNEEDLELLFDALANMFEFDKSAARPQMATRKVIAFKHSSRLGNAPAHKLFDLIDVKRKDGVEYPRSFSDYEVTIDKDAKPNGVEIIDMLDCEPEADTE
ncbi:CRISPR-associated protein, Csd2 family (plasmid) [Peptoclostridium acidaminophilum DSM 3953]|uniref:CRISPR-associated protein, Csd2 family n=1 Tax=Peptoclostridium acidaminophilum DSM 3953 TaxID=1286171 RepID=W8T702_PEPAC|nr:type I-C CRISPR-associated protein Cas7/Csd2 [Peptoclostridium acidaminophilum]AHM57524.1 CRISPR-associated protein, Csd2 family [Peptoclostridium acidaminophilum DSM 3953]